MLSADVKDVSFAVALTIGGALALRYSTRNTTHGVLGIEHFTTGMCVGSFVTGLGLLVLVSTRHLAAFAR